MRVLALVTDAFGGYGGIAQYNRDFFRALADSEHISNVCILPRLGQADASIVADKLQQLDPVSARAAYCLTALRTALREGPFDLIFCGHLYHSPLAVSVGRLLGVPIWLQTHGIDAWERPTPLLRASVERSSLITTVSRYTRRRLLTWCNIAASRVRVLPNTVRDSFRPGPVSVPTLAKFGLAGAKIILTVSRIAKTDSYKGHGRVIRAMAAVLDREPRAVYVVVGDGDARSDLETLADAHGVAGAVRFLGRLSDVDIEDLYRSADVFVMPSTKEGFGIVFLEAVAAGLPAIGGNMDGSVDALADGQIGRIIDPLSHEQIVGALLDALREGRSSSGAVVERFRFANFAAHVDGLVQDVFDLNRVAAGRGNDRAGGTTWVSDDDRGCSL